MLKRMARAAGRETMSTSALAIEMREADAASVSPSSRRSPLRGALPLVALCAAVGGTNARADIPVSVGTDGALERAAVTASASRNASAASFGATSDDDRRLFKLRWRIPLYVAGDEESEITNFSLPFGLNGSSFNTGYQNLRSIPGFANYADEPLTELTSYIPQIELGEERKLARLQMGVLSASVGHGSLVNAYTNAPEGVRRTFGMLAEGNLAGLGGQIISGNLLSPHQFTAARVYGRPLLWIFAPDATFQPNELDIDPRTEGLGIWVTGLSAAVDVDAPMANTGLGDRSFIWATGWDNEAAILDNQLIKLIPYLDLNVMGGLPGGLLGDVAMGAHLGAETMFDVAGVRFDIDAEYNVGSDGYVPRYFDRLYTIDREDVLGVDGDAAKAGLDAPASHGYRVRLSTGFLEMFTAFLEAQDQFPMDFNRGINSARLNAGLSGWFAFIGGSVSVSQSGITEYTSPGLMGPGFVFVAEGRVAVLLNILHIVARHYRTHVPDSSGTDFTVETGTLVGLEVNLDVL